MPSRRPRLARSVDGRAALKQLRSERADVDREMGRLTEAIATGGLLAPLRDAVSRLRHDADPLVGHYARADDFRADEVFSPDARAEHRSHQRSRSSPSGFVTSM
jgi:hypothetical protein